MKRPAVGDVIEIPLSDGHKAFAYFVFYDPENGPLIRVFDLIANSDIQVAQLQDAGQLFSPVFTGLFAAVRVGMWRVVGRLPIEEFEYPKFLSTVWNEKTGEAGEWFLWDGNEYHRLGSELTAEYKQLEFMAVWDPHDIVWRSETGEYPEPYGSLIRDNRYKPGDLRQPG